MDYSRKIPAAYAFASDRVASFFISGAERKSWNKEKSLKSWLASSSLSLLSSMNHCYLRSSHMRWSVCLRSAPEWKWIHNLFSQHPLDGELFQWSVSLEILWWNQSYPLQSELATGTKFLRRTRAGPLIPPRLALPLGLMEKFSPPFFPPFRPLTVKSFPDKLHQLELNSIEQYINVAANVSLHNTS